MHERSNTILACLAKPVGLKNNILPLKSSLSSNDGVGDLMIAILLEVGDLSKKDRGKGEFEFL